MSYILDALRRANSERERGSVPTLNTDPGPADLTIDEDEIAERPAPRGKMLALWAACVIGAGVIGFAAVWLLRGHDEPLATAGAPARPQSQDAPRTELPAPAPMADAALASAPAAATVPLSVPPLAEPNRPTLASVASAPTLAPAPSEPLKSSVSAPAAARIPTKAELPEDIRKQLPQLVTGGAMYSDAPAARMVIFNGQVFHEGDKLTPDLVLEQIMLKGAVLSFKGQRFSIAY